MWHGYFLASKPTAITADEWTKLKNLFHTLGADDASNLPAHRLQWRESLDGSACIIEAVFDETRINVTTTTNLIAEIRAAIANRLTASAIRTAFASKVQFFGGVGADWEKSRQACIDYLVANSAAWEQTI